MMKHLRRIALVTLALLALLLVAGAICQFFYFGGGEDERKPIVVENPDQFRYPPLKTITAHITMAEKPSAKTVLLVDDAGEAYREFYEHVGIKCFAKETSRRYDIVLAVDGEERDWGKLAGQLSENGILARLIHVRNMPAKSFREILADFPGDQVHLWMLSETDWLITGRMKTCMVKLDAVMDSFSREGAFHDLAKASCDSLGELFASYIGEREEVMPAFSAGDLTAPVRPEFFMTDSVAPIPWIDVSGVESDICGAASDDIRAARQTRLLVVKGSMCSRDPARNEEAIVIWAEAARRNPHDPMLLERLYQLAINAKAFRDVGNIKGAAKCFETMIAIRPKDVAAIRLYAECMKMLGETEISKQVLKRAEEIENEK